jgi:hypothetical protein
MTIQFSEFSFSNQSNRSGRFVLEAPIGQNVLEFPFNPGAFLKLNPDVEAAESARLAIFIRKGETLSELNFEPQINASYEGGALQNYVTALRFEFVDDAAKLSVDTECTAK